MIILGIDPGLTGAIAVYDTEGDCYHAIIDMPLMERDYGSGQQIDWTKLKHSVTGVLDVLQNNQYEVVKSIIENVGVMPSQGAVSGFQFGRTMGGLECMMAVMDIPVYKIHPATWKRKLGLIASDKKASLDMVRNVYPEMIPLLKLAKHHNRAEAMAIAVAGAKLL